MGWAYLT
jgi:hypothetical protein